MRLTRGEAAALVGWASQEDVDRDDLHSASLAIQTALDIVADEESAEADEERATSALHH